MSTPGLTADAFVHGTVLREPAGREAGYWVGAPGAFYDAQDRAFYLTYRVRRPRGVHPDRGAEAYIARSRDGLTFEDTWRVTKDAFATTSIERCAVRRGPDGVWRYFACYVDPADQRWTISVLRADRPDRFDPGTARPVFKAAELGLEGIKDPWIYAQDGQFVMVVSVALATASTSDRSHATFDIYNTGECISATGLAVSTDLDRWEWRGVVFRPGSDGWDRYCRRINSFVRRGGRYLAFYDGSASHQENYEEKAALAVSADLSRWETKNPDGPAFVSPQASRSLRYVDAQLVGEDAYLYYEIARADGAHDLRVVKTAAADLDALL